MRQLFIILLVIIPCVLKAQQRVVYEWESNRSRYKLNTEEQKHPEYILKTHVQYDYYLENNDFLMYHTMHKIVHVNSNEAIEKNNRIYVPMNSTFELVDLKARSISKDGKVVNFDSKNLKEIKDEKGDNRYRIFAVEGVETGSEIEFFFVRKMDSHLFERVFMQTDVPVKKASFVLSCPDHLMFDFKSYLGLPAVVKEVKNERNVFSTSMENITAMKKEEFSYYDNNRKRIEFKLAYNNAKSKARMYTWDDAAKRFYEHVSAHTKDEAKALEKYYKTLGDKTGIPMAQRIKTLEEKMKTTVQIDENASGTQTSDIASIIKTKVASNLGMTRLMYGVFSQAQIPVQIVMTCDREVSRLDPQFDTWGYLDEFFLYFPDTKGFVAPYKFDQRYPFIPHEYVATHGLFIEAFAMGELKSGLGTVKLIPAPDYKVSCDNMDIQVTFADDLEENRVVLTRSFSGYNSRFIAPYYNLMKNEDKQRLMEELVKDSAPDAVIKSWAGSVTQKDVIDVFEMKTDFTTAHFLEKAGNRVLFKVGELIGRQTELYQEETRITPVENDYNRGYERVITVKLPAGYTVKNPADINFKVLYQGKENSPYGFVSTYTLNGSELTIRIDEYYKEISAPLEAFPDFRKVINAAADFNKVTLVLEKSANQ